MLPFSALQTIPYEGVLSGLDGSLSTSILPVMTLVLSVFSLVVVGEVAKAYLRN